MLGGTHPVLIQSMANTPALDTKATVEQIEQLVALGCHIVRVAVPTLKEAENLKFIKQELIKKGITIPLVADVHFSPKVAERAAHYVEKVRINPGNYLTDKTKLHYSQEDFETARQQIAHNIQPLLATCKKHKTALRVGVNWGSLSKRILYRYGNTAKGMVASALEFIEILLESGFEQFTLSLKASDVRIMQEANVMLVKEMIQRDTFFPLHLGVTEAGAGTDARIKSAAGIGALLKLGIGDTIRVSLTESPEAEIPVAMKLLPYAQQKGVILQFLNRLNFHPEKADANLAKMVGHTKPLILSDVKTEKADFCFDNGHLLFTTNGKEIPVEDIKPLVIESNEPDLESFIIDTSVALAAGFLRGNPRGVLLRNPNFSASMLVQLSFDILQGLGLRFSKTEYVACPGCGRTLFNIMEQLKAVQKKTSHYKTLKIAVMGCIINGPGEMADADYGYVGSAKGKVTLYKAGKVVRRNIPEAAASDVLSNLIEEDMKGTG